MGVNLVEVTVQVVETLTERMAFLANFAQAPLADQGSRVIGLLQGFGYGEVLFAQALPAHISSCISTDVSVTHVLACHEHASRWGAHRASGVKPGELHSFFGHLVETRGLDQFLSEASEIPVAEVVGHDEDQVGLGLGEGSGEECERKEEFRGHLIFLPGVP